MEAKKGGSDDGKKWERPAESTEGIAPLSVSPDADVPTTARYAAPATTLPFDLSQIRNEVANFDFLEAQQKALRNMCSQLHDIASLDPERDVYEELTGNRPHDPSIYSRKVFIGGLPKTMSGEELTEYFSDFGPVLIDWPHRERVPDRPPHGYSFAVFARAVSVEALVLRCQVVRGKHCIYIGPYCVQIRPWIKSDREHFMPGYDQISSMRTQRWSIFIGGVARTTTSRILAETIDETIGDVVSVKIEVDYDTDYPKGAARVIFSCEKAYVSAIARRFISMQSQDLHKDECKEVEMKPYLEDCMICERCYKMSTRLFCAELRCLKYFCDQCWKIHHSAPAIHSEHRPMLKGIHQAPKYTSIPGGGDRQSLRRAGSFIDSTVGSFYSGRGNTPPASPTHPSAFHDRNLGFYGMRSGGPAAAAHNFQNQLAAFASVRSRHGSRRGVLDYRIVDPERGYGAPHHLAAAAAAAAGLFAPQPQHSNDARRTMNGMGTSTLTRTRTQSQNWHPDDVSLKDTFAFMQAMQARGGGRGGAVPRHFPPVPSPFSPTSTTSSGGAFSFDESSLATTPADSLSAPNSASETTRNRMFFPH